ncbi:MULTISPECIES: universal stress protein [unclassified Streptomyces]|uniref:universal stress protein n=1 Tax=unclassified Streptomyces TaxID=2593676 RepID=UPI003D91449D
MSADSPQRAAPSGDHMSHLAEASTPQRGRDVPVAAAGRFRVYLGMASGVGKTYAMLDEAVRRAARGCDVVAGIVETHDRPATTAKLEGLEVVPPKTVTYRGAQFAEMDLDAILARRPELVLVDELAHSNVPGSGRHEKRWQDVLELLDADISVIGTLNTQHIESLADAVEAITGTRVRERIPDAVLARADQIELVDSSPEQLRRRMLHGNIYPAERIRPALNGFFQTENLTDLRDLTLRFLGGETDDETLAQLRRTAAGRSGGAVERVLVGVTDEAGTETVWRRACRIAAGLAADLYVVHVHPSDGLGRPWTVALQPIRQLTEQSGGTWIEIEDDDPARALMRAAAEHSATHIVLGPSRRSRWLHLLAGGSTVRRLTRLAGDAGIDVHIIARPTISAAGDPHFGQAWPEGSADPTTAPDQGKPAATIWWQDGWWKKCR